MINYIDDANSQANRLQEEILEYQLNYWAEQLRDLPIVHSVPLDRPRSSAQSFVEARITSQIERSTKELLDSLCRSQNATLFMALQAAFSVLLSRYSNETDIVMGTPADREQVTRVGLMGSFENLLVLRNDLTGDPSFTALLAQSKAMLLSAYAHQKIHFAKIVERLQPKHILSHSPLFQIMLVLKNNEPGILVKPDLARSPAELEHISGNYDLTLNIAEVEQGLRLDWDYNKDLFDANTIAKMAKHFEILLCSLLASPNNSIFSVEMLSVAEQNQLLIEWNNSAVDYPKNKCIYELFETQVFNNSDAVALIFEGQQLTYGELNLKANQLAHYLISEMRVRPDTLVGICVERSLEMVIGILGILKAGGAYVLLDPDDPEVHLKYILDDANLKTVIIQRHLLATKPVRDSQALCWDDNDFQAILQQQSTLNPNKDLLGLTPRHLAYVTYTSGSTGNPKAVLIAHRSIINRISWMNHVFPVKNDEVFCQKAAVGFVDHATELFHAFACGNPLVIARKLDVFNENSFVQLIVQHKITRLTLVPSLLKYLIVNGWLAKMPSLRLVISSGEALLLEEARKFYRDLPSAQLLNLYGSSEVGDVSAYSTYALNENPDVMQYFLDTTLEPTLDKKPLVKFSYRPLKSTIDNSIFRAKYNDSLLPQGAVAYQAYLDELEKSILPFSVDVAAKRFVGHMTSKLPSFIPELSHLIAQLNQNMVKVETSNNLTLIERQVLAMMHRLFFKMPSDFYEKYCQDPLHIFGVVTGGGSVSNLIALWCGRSRGLLALGATQADMVYFGAHSLLQQYGFKGAVILGTRLMHYSIKKSAAVMGLGEASIMYVQQDASQKMCMTDLQNRIKYCQQHGLFIIAIVGIAGATETGTVDPLKEIAAIASENHIYFHVDAAWGGAFQFSQRYCQLLSGIEFADSITFCPHKQLYLSQGISLCLLRDTQSASSIATYANYQSQKGSYDLGQYSVEGSRPANALLLHANLYLIGQKGYSWLIEQSMNKTRFFALIIRQSSSFELIGNPELNVVNYRYIPVSLRSRSSYSPAEQAEINDAVTRIQQRQFSSGTSFVSKTTVQLIGNDEPIIVFRVVLSNPLTKYSDLRDVLTDQLLIANELIECDANHSHNQLRELSYNMIDAYSNWNVPIGRSIASTQLLVLNARKSLVPCGACGELYVGGAGLARGYLNRPDLTAERFVPNPFYDKDNPESSERLYKTGDLVRWLPDGNLEFLGRIDQQIKIRGFRIELGEIENSLNSHPMVKNVVVVSKKSGSNGNESLVAYVISASFDFKIEKKSSVSGHSEFIEAMRHHLSQSLPDYMIPTEFVLLNEFPLMPNGKIDRKVLSELGMPNIQNIEITACCPSPYIG